MINLKNDLGYTYINGFTEMKKAKIQNTMEKKYNYSGKVMNSYELIVTRMIKENMYPSIKENYSYYSARTGEKTKPKTLYKLAGEGFYYELNKTQYDFAMWLVDTTKTINIGFIRELETKEENRVLEIEKAQAEAEEKKQLEKIKVEQENKDFENWLYEKINTYNNQEKISIAERIYLDTIGSYSDLQVRRILVLIDNIDNDKCREYLIEYLGIHNKASRKVFHYVTGIKLPPTNKDSKELLSILSSNDYKGILEYKTREKKEQEETTPVKFYIRIGDNLKLVEGIEVNNNYGLKLYMRKDENGLYTITEGSTGCALVNTETTKADTMKKMKEKLTGEMLEKIKGYVSQLIQKYGELPPVA